MRLVRGAAPGASLGEMWSAMRDGPILPSAPPSQAQAIIASRANVIAPPSKAHLRRLKKERPFLERPRAYQESEKAKDLRQCNAFHKSQMALLGGTRTVAPAPEPIVRPKQTWVYVKPSRDTELYPEPKPLAPPAPDRRKDHLIALARAGLEVDMFRVLEVFPSFEAFQGAVSHG